LIKRIFLPGSVRQWIFFIFLVVALPLLYSNIDTALEITRYTQGSRKSLFQTVKIVDNSRLLLNNLVSMERTIRQFQILKELALFDSYLKSRDKFLALIKSFKTSDLPTNLVGIIDSIAANEALLYQTISFAMEDIDQFKLNKTALNSFDQLTEQARQLVTEAEKNVGIEAANLSVSAQQVGKDLIYSAILSASFALLLGLVCIYLLTRPIKSIIKAIRHLGEVEFDRPISIKGPYELVELGNHLEWLRQRLNQLEYEKKQFIRNISHELKTPLASLKEGTDLLAENVVGELNVEQQEIIQLMKMANVSINELVENLLAYQKAISTQIECIYSTFQVNTLITRVINEYALLLRSKSVSVETELAEVDIVADHDKLKIIISNIFSNALKFSPQEGVIRVSLILSNEMVQIIIEDQGIGIDSAMLPLIFEDFYQGESSGGWKIKASGLGLSLVRHYLAAHDGSIELLPVTERFPGARFSILIPQHYP